MLRELIERAMVFHVVPTWPVPVRSDYFKENRMSLQQQFIERRQWLETRILGQSQLVERLLIALLADGHLLVEGAPGLAKTKAVKTLAEGLEGDFHRVQFTPDL